MKASADYIKKHNKNIIFKTKLEREVIFCDPLAVEKILLNLLSNAVKFTNKGDKIIVRLYKKKYDIFISVKDTGIGIKEKDQKTIFEEFEQVDKSLSRKQEGSGLGLSIVKNLVDIHEGEIKFKSKYNKGSEFILRIPATKTPYEKIDFRIVNENIEDRIKVEFSDIYF